MWQVLSLGAVRFIKPHIYGFNNFVVIFVEDTVGVRFETISNHEAFIGFRLKFRLMMRLTNPTWCAEDLEVTYIGLLTNQKAGINFFEKIYKNPPIGGWGASFICS